MTTSTPVPAGPRGLDQLMRLGAALPLAPGCERFYFLRHGQTERNARRIFQAPTEPLNATGMEQARQAAGVLAGEPIATIVCSDILRALDTAIEVASRHGLDPVPHAGLRERNFGALIGSSSVGIDWACAPDGGETLETFVDRSRAGLAYALAHTGPVLVVAHGGSLYVLAAVLGVVLTDAFLGNAQPLRFDRRAGAWRATPLAAADGGAANLA